MSRKHAHANCEDCPLYIGGVFVPSEGPAKSTLAIVGEAPGVMEARQGKLFVGPAGKLLQTVLRHHGLDKGMAFLTNATLCRPPDGSTPPKSAISSCKPRLEHELQEHGVETVLALGNTAAVSLLGKTGIHQLRVGPGKPAPFDEDIRVIPTIHPAACLRQGDSLPFLVSDVGKINGRREPWVAPQYWVADTPLEALYAIHFLRNNTGEGPLAVDIEVDVEKDTAFDHPNQYGMLCIGVGYAKRKVIVFASSSLNAQVYAELAALLRERDLIAQNGKFDLAGLFPHLGALTLWFDTMLASYVFDERPGIHGLKWQAVEYLGAPQYDQEIAKYVGRGSSYAAIPRGILHRYNAYDVACTYDLWLMYEAKFASTAGEGLRRVHDFLVAASNELVYVELNGISVDRAYLNDLSHDYAERIRAIEDEIDRTLQGSAGPTHSVNPRSPLQVKKVLLENKIRVASTNVDTIETVIAKTEGIERFDTVRQFCLLLLKHRRESKIHGTYIKGIGKRLYRGRVYPTFMLHGTTTGRLSCRNPNLQNIPRESSIRRMFVPAKPGYVFIQTDYSQAELRVLSYLARDRYFRDIFNEGERDLFDELTPILYPSAEKTVLGPAAWKELRIRVKAYVYGLSYGRTAQGIASEYDIPVPEAQRGMNAFFSVIPEIVTFRDNVKKDVLAGQYLITPFGRRRRFGLITDENVNATMNEALAFLPQSTASDMCLDAMGHIRRNLRGIGWVRNIIHDAVLAEAKEEDAEEVAAMMNREMVASARRVVGDYVVFATESKIGTSWGEV